MQVSVTTTEGLGRRMTVELPAERVEGQVQERLKSMVGSVRIAGFRPGKVPFKVVKQRYGTQVRQEVESELVRTTLYEAIQQEKLRPAATPKVEVDASADTALAYTAEFEVYPEVNVVVPEGVKVSKAAADITDQDVDNMLEKLRSQRAAWVKEDRSAELGDNVIIDFVGKIDGVAFDGGEAKAFALELGSKRFIAGFEDQLVGLSAGESKDIEVPFPESYQNKDLAGKPAVFEVTLQEVQGSQLPELDSDDFLAGMGIADGGIDALRADVKENMSREMTQAISAQLKNSVLDALLDANTVELPQSLVDGEIQQMAQEARQNMGIPAEEGELPVADDIRAAFEESAKRRVTLGLLIGEVLKEQGISADADKVRARIESQAVSYEDPKAVLDWYYEDKSRLASVEALVLEDQVVDWLTSQLSVETESKTFDEIMQPAKA